MPGLSRRAFGLTTLGLMAGPAHAGGWAAIEAEARGQTVYFNAWAGSETVNAYIAWAGAELQQRFAITLTHVKIADTAEVVRRVRDEVAAGRAGGSVDLVWINGENFRAMKEGQLLFGPFAEALPNFALADTAGKPAILNDFALPVEGYESPWGMAQLTFFADSARVPEPPASYAALRQWCAANPGRFTYPAPPDFHGTTFVKQVLAETIADRFRLSAPAADDDFQPVTAPLWTALDALHPHLWRRGKQFPLAQAAMTQMLADGEIMIAFTFNPSEPANLVAAGTLPPTAVAWQFTGGTIGNAHFLAIPVNAQAPAAAQVVANFLLSPEAQARKADLKVWGDPTVLDLGKLMANEQALFSASGANLLKPAGPTIAEPHGSWVPKLEAEWLKRYGV
jgi:putative thiamine transport system substrate-binding protein